KPAFHLDGPVGGERADATVGPSGTSLFSTARVWRGANFNAPKAQCAFQSVRNWPGWRNKSGRQHHAPGRPGPAARAVTSPGDIEAIPPRGHPRETSRGYPSAGYPSPGLRIRPASTLPLGVSVALLHPILVRLHPPAMIGAVLQVLLRHLWGVLEPRLAEDQLAIAHHGARGPVGHRHAHPIRAGH